MGTMTTTSRTVRLDVAEEVIATREEETGEPCTRRVYFVVAIIEGSTRFWPDFVHGHLFNDKHDAYRLLERIEYRWSETPSVAHFEGNANWTRNNAPDPMTELAPFGEEWEAEQIERAAERGVL
jgi:hypothetical protein